MSYASLNWDYSSLLLEHGCKTGITAAAKSVRTRTKFSWTLFWKSIRVAPNQMTFVTGSWVATSYWVLAGTRQPYPRRVVHLLGQSSRCLSAQPLSAARCLSQPLAGERQSGTASRGLGGAASADGARPVPTWRKPASAQKPGLCPNQGPGLSHCRPGPGVVFTSELFQRPGLLPVSCGSVSAPQHRGLLLICVPMDEGFVSGRPAAAGASLGPPEPPASPGWPARPGPAWSARPLGGSGTARGASPRLAVELSLAARKLCRIKAFHCCPCLPTPIAIKG